MLVFGICLYVYFCTSVRNCFGYAPINIVFLGSCLPIICVWPTTGFLLLWLLLDIRIDSFVFGSFWIPVPKEKMAQSGFLELGYFVMCCSTSCTILLLNFLCTLFYVYVIVSWGVFGWVNFYSYTEHTVYFLPPSIGRCVVEYSYPENDCILKYLIFWIYH